MGGIQFTLPSFDNRISHVTCYMRRKRNAKWLERLSHARHVTWSVYDFIGGYWSGSWWRKGVVEGVRRRGGLKVVSPFSGFTVYTLKWAAYLIIILITTVILFLGNETAMESNIHLGTNVGSHNCPLRSKLGILDSDYRNAIIHEWSFEIRYGKGNYKFNLYNRNTFWKRIPLNFKTSTYIHPYLI